jgi:hypothetical protein
VPNEFTTDGNMVWQRTTLQQMMGLICRTGSWELWLHDEKKLRPAFSVYKIHHTSSLDQLFCSLCKCFEREKRTSDHIALHGKSPKPVAHQIVWVGQVSWPHCNQYHYQYAD